MSSIPFDPLVSAPAAAAGTVAVACPFCRSTQFLVERRLTGMGHALIWTGLGITLISIPLMAILIGFLTIVVGLGMMIVGRFQQKYVNICISCKRHF